MQERATLESPVPAPLELPVERLIRPTKRRLRLRDFVNDAPVVRIITARDLKVRYKQSLLGPLWLVIQPLALLAGFLVAFQGLAGVETAGLPYVVFALVGLSVWSFFQAAMTIGTASLISSSNLIRFTPCPRLAFPLAAVIASLPAFGVTAAGAVVATTVTGHLSVKVLLLPLALIWLLLLTLAIVCDLVLAGGSLPRHQQRPALPASGGAVLRPDRLSARRGLLDGPRAPRSQSPDGRHGGRSVDGAVGLRALHRADRRSRSRRRRCSRWPAGACSRGARPRWRTRSDVGDGSRRGRRRSRSAPRDCESATGSASTAACSRPSPACCAGARRR